MWSRPSQEKRHSFGLSGLLFRTCLLPRPQCLRLFLVSSLTSAPPTEPQNHFVRPLQTESCQNSWTVYDDETSKFTSGILRVSLFSFASKVVAGVVCKCTPVSQISHLLLINFAALADRFHWISRWRLNWHVVLALRNFINARYLHFPGKDLGERKWRDRKNPFNRINLEMSNVMWLFAFFASWSAVRVSFFVQFHFWIKIHFSRRFSPRQHWYVSETQLTETQISRKARKTWQRWQQGRLAPPTMTEMTEALENGLEVSCVVLTRGWRSYDHKDQDDNVTRVGCCT